MQGLAAAGALAALGPWPGQARGRARPVPELAGQHLELSIWHAPVDFTGRSRLATTGNGSLPGPILRFRESDPVTLRVANQLRDAWSSIHWHGLLLPAYMDGVPGLSFDGIPPARWLMAVPLRCEAVGHVLVPQPFHVPGTGRLVRRNRRRPARTAALPPRPRARDPALRLDRHGPRRPLPAHEEMGHGLSGVEAGLRMRYEVTRQFAPYVGLVHSRTFGATSAFRRASGEPARDTRAVVGLRIWF